MYHLLPVRTIVRAIIVTHIFILVLFVYLFSFTSSPIVLLRYVGISVSIFDIVILIVAYNLWRWLWRKFPILANIYYPDLNGIWEGKITFEAQMEKGKKEEHLSAKARIRQNLWNIHIDLCSTTSQSHTLVAFPTVESGNKKLYYIYQNIPQNPKYFQYQGTCLLQVNDNTVPAQLSGQYYTMRQTIGRLELRQISANPKDEYLQ